MATINQNVKSGRGWNGNLSLVNNVCNLIVEKGLADASTSEAYSKTIHQYYRFYNDGDFPSIIRKYDLTMKRSSKEDKIKALETELDKNLIAVLKSVSNKEFDDLKKSIRENNRVSRINTFINSAKKIDIHSFVPYKETSGFNQSGLFYSRLKKNDLNKMPNIEEKISELTTLAKEYDVFLKDNYPELSSYILPYVKEKIADYNDSENKDKFYDFYFKFVKLSDSVVVSAKKAL